MKIKQVVVVIISFLVTSSMQAMDTSKNNYSAMQVYDDDNPEEITREYANRASERPKKDLESFDARFEELHGQNFQNRRSGVTRFELPKEKRISATTKKIIIAAGISGVLLAAGTLYYGLKAYQKKTIKKVLEQYIKKVSDFSKDEQDMMAAAFYASLRVPGAFWYLKKCVSTKNSEISDLLWQILAQIYYRRPVIAAIVETFRTMIEGEALAQKDSYSQQASLPDVPDQTALP